MSNAPNAILAISSTDRYTKQLQGNANQPISDILRAQFFNDGPYSNDFSITAPNALINGYIEKIIVSQIQLQYYVPTIIPGRNDRFAFLVETATGSGAYTPYSADIPYGFWSPKDLASTLEVIMNAEVYGSPYATNFSVRYSQGSIGAVPQVGFTIILNDGGRRVAIDNPFRIQYTEFDTARLLKTYRTFGFDVTNIEPQTKQVSGFAPVLLYTPYIDIYSDALTNYQALKDTDSSTIRRKGLVSRVYLSGVGSPQVTTYNVISTVDEDGNLISQTTQSESLGSQPFTLTYDLNSPKVINWTPDTAVNSLDFQMRDCYGDLLFSVVPGNAPGVVGESFNTEFQMTLLCIEKDR
jgi:hypothetical protein